MLVVLVFRKKLVMALYRILKVLNKTILHMCYVLVITAEVLMVSEVVLMFNKKF